MNGEEAIELGHRDGLWARAGTMILSGWLVVSSLAWDHGSPARINALVVGYLVFVFATVATLADGVRVLNTLLGAWLVISVWVLPPALPLMRLDTMAVGGCLLALSLVGRQGGLGLPPLRAFLRELEPPSARGR